MRAYKALRLISGGAWLIPIRSAPKNPSINSTFNWLPLVCQGLMRFVTHTCTDAGLIHWKGTNLTPVESLTRYRGRGKCQLSLSVCATISRTTKSAIIDGCLQRIARRHKQVSGTRAGWPIPLFRALRHHDTNFFKQIEAMCCIYLNSRRRDGHSNT